MTTLKVTVIDNHVAVILPPDLVEQLGVGEGSEITFDSGVMRPAESVADQQLRAMRDVMRRRRDVLRRLAE